MHHYQRCVRFIVVCLLLATVSPPVFSDDWVYSVKKGDNLWDLTVDYLKDISYVKKVQELNQIQDPWLLLPGTEIKIPAQWLRSFPLLVRVRSVQGVAELIDEDTGNTSKLIPGSLIIIGETILTDENSSVVLEFINGSQLTVEENSVLTVDYLGGYEFTGMTDYRLHLKKGRLETQVAPRKGSASQFKITTPVAVTSVRGTDYRISSKPARSSSLTEVLEGTVGVSSSGIIQLIPQGFGSIAIADHPPEPPVKLLDPPIIDAVRRLYGRVPIQFSLPALAKEQGYRVQIAETSLFNNILFNKTFSSALIRTVTLPDGKYTLRIRGIDKQGLEGKNAELEITLNARPEAPFLVEPKPGAGIVEESPTFEWSKNAAANGHHFQLAETKNFTKLLVDINNHRDARLTVEKPLPIGKYYWRVAAIDREGDGPFSDAQLLRRILPAPDMEEPEISENTLVIRFRKGLPGQRYQVQLSEDKSFSTLLIDELLDNPFLELPRPDAGDYFVRIRSIDPDGFIGPFGSPQVIEIPREGLYWLLLLLPLLALIAI